MTAARRRMTRCRRFVVSGRVQGVGFRYAACVEAQRRALSGWVRNLASGDVEVVACGDDDELHAFERWLWQGPRAARVASVATAEVTVQDIEGFEVR